jgi:hypothetical protein
MVMRASNNFTQIAFFLLLLHGLQNFVLLSRVSEPWTRQTVSPLASVDFEYEKEGQKGRGISNVDEGVGHLAVLRG